MKTLTPALYTSISRYTVVELYCGIVLEDMKNLSNTYIKVWIYNFPSVNSIFIFVTCMIRVIKKYIIQNLSINLILYCSYFNLKKIKLQ